MGGISPTSLQGPRRAELLAFEGWCVCVSCKGRSVTSTGGSDASNLGGSCAAGVGELRRGHRLLLGQASDPRGSETREKAGDVS